MLILICIICTTHIGVIDFGCANHAYIKSTTRDPSKKKASIQYIEVIEKFYTVFQLHSTLVYVKGCPISSGESFCFFITLFDIVAFDAGCLSTKNKWFILRY